MQRIRGLFEQRGISIIAHAKMAGIKQSILNNIVKGIIKTAQRENPAYNRIGFQRDVSGVFNIQPLKKHSFEEVEDDNEE